MSDHGKDMLYRDELQALLLAVELTAMTLGPHAPIDHKAALGRLFVKLERMAAVAPSRPAALAAGQGNDSISVDK
jgi:hypothetical protein